jgi:hypothetical protein
MEAAQRTLQQRAEALARRVGADCATGAADPHQARGKVERCRSQSLTRARFQIALVLEDPAGAVHNAVFAHSLLDDAERQLSTRED